MSTDKGSAMLPYTACLQAPLPAHYCAVKTHAPASYEYMAANGWNA